MQSQATPVTDIPRMKKVPGHHAATPFLITSDMFEGVDLDIAGAEISDLVGKPVADPHQHGVPEIYLLVSREPGDAHITVFVGDEQFEMDSPAAFYIPAEVTHHFVTRRAAFGTFMFGILVGHDDEVRDAPV
jgi:hypothetical protein